MQETYYGNSRDSNFQKKKEQAEPLKFQNSISNFHVITSDVEFPCDQ